ncbi:hypothetical protein K503DRAFT_869974 [Rhizopogon vinicolor AM-OR11-026]|uniref:DUF6533 domain-containing protein n=1 Tax=Rhizopogon vinicolor AM-OR11-026 TaxID=1314800 RepID=A0A1B7MJJ2_9AGAM|nr:hypothetical protein K503DRAFT_869974 [Rhizopogon vinicolor AM-OR11-026]
MTLVSDDPSWWLLISSMRQSSYFLVACLTAVVYDWALTFGQEFELVWRRRRSPMTFLYLSVRYLGILYTVVMMMVYLPSALLTDAVSTIFYLVLNWISIIGNIMLDVIIITRLYAMYQQSKQMLIFLVAFLAIKATSTVITMILTIMRVSGEELVLSGAHMCTYSPSGDGMIVFEVSWIVATAWETLVLCLAVWIAVKHFRELQRPSTRWIVGDCFMILVKTHVFYFASFVSVSSLQLSEDFSPKLLNLTSAAAGIFIGILEFTRVVQIFIMGPRLILEVREYHANHVSNSDEGSDMASIVFHERVHISSGGGV